MAKKNKTQITSSFVGINKTQIKVSIYKVEKNIPIPAPIKSNDRKSKYPFDQMKIGNSFLIKTPKDISPERRTIIASSIVSCGRTNSKGTRKYLWRILKDKSIRIWRVK